MCKKLISFFIVMCLSFNIITALGEEIPALRESSSEMSASEESLDVSSAENFTDDNIIYQALQERNEGASLFSDSSADEINVSFDVVLGFDMSSDMYGFDYNGEMAWKDDFAVMQEQAPAGTRFSVVTGETGEFGADLNSMIGTLPATYSGSTDILTLLENCADTFDNESDDRNKVVIATIAEVSDSTALENEMDELRSEGIVPFVFVLNTENNNTIDDIDGIYRCMSSLELRLAVSDLYLSFAEFDSAAENIAVNDDEYGVMPLNNSASTPNDYKPDKHKITGYDSNIGKALISVLNIYGAVPMYISSNGMESTGYNMLDGSISNDDIASFKEANNAELSSDLVNIMSPSWENIFQQIEDGNNDFITDVDTALENNIKRRFPVIAFDEAVDSIEILTGSSDAGSHTYAFDTYEYLMKMVTRTNTAVTEDDSADRAEKIILNYPITADASYKLYGYEADTENVNLPENVFMTSNSSCELNMMLPSNITSINYAIAVETKYDNGMPDMIYTNKFYISRGYTDLIPGKWYRDYVLDATNKGFVQGMGDGTFSPEGTLTRGQFLVMLLNAADIDLDDYDEIGFANYENSETLSLVQSKMLDWVKKYMNYALKNLLINETQYIGDIESDIPQYGFEQKLNRAETTYILYMMFIGNLESIRVPSNIYFYDTNMSNYKTELWSKHRAFAEQQEENSALNDMNYVQQMYYNNVLDGMPGNADEGDDPSKIYFYPNKTLTRAEACKVVLKCLFELNDNIPEIQANIFEEDVEAVPLPDGDHIKDRYVLDSIPFDATNQILYEFHVDDNKEYAIETTGGSVDTTTWGRLYYVDGNSTVNNITLDGSNHMLIVFQGAGDYRLRIKRTGNADVGLRMTTTGISDLEFTKSTDSNFIYVNNPEYITKYDIVDSGYIESDQDKALKIFEQAVSGKNTYYQTHISWYNNPSGHEEDFPDENGFYLDIDLFNPNEYMVTVTISNLVSGNEYSYLTNYFGNGSGFTIELQPGEHKLLLDNDMFSNPLFVVPEHKNMSILFDFSVDKGEIILSSMAAYNHQNLTMMPGSNNMLSNGTELNNGDVIYPQNNYVRPGEADLYGKYKGIALQQSAQIEGVMEFTITNSDNSGDILQVNLHDKNYSKGVHNPNNMWMTHTNPISDGWDGTIFAMPSVLHNFKYHFETGQTWNFDYKHRNTKNDNITINSEDTSVSVNNAVPSTILDNVEQDVSKGEKSVYNVPSDWNIELHGIPADTEALSMAAWGTTYHYTITIKNASSNNMTVAFQIKNSENVIFGLRELGEVNYNPGIYSIGNGDYWEERTADIPKESIKTFEVITLPCGGNSGMNNRICLK